VGHCRGNVLQRSVIAPPAIGELIRDSVSFASTSFFLAVVVFFFMGISWVERRGTSPAEEL
jgi:hypothetical protein